MNYDILFAIAFYLILYLIFLKNREKFDVQNKIFVMYRTQWGIKLMDKIAEKFPRLLKALGFVSVTTGFLGMGAIFYILIQGTLKLITTPEAQPVLAPILPGVSVPGVPILSFWHWIIGILVIAVVHEYMHGIYSRLYKIKVKSSGFAFLGPILAAFVEPDEDQLKKASKYKQLAIISAGPFANFLFAIFMILVLIFVLNPLGSALAEPQGVKITSIDPNLPINNTALKADMTIDKINNIAIKDPAHFTEVLTAYSPGEIIVVESNSEQIPVLLAAREEDASKPRLGVSITYEEIQVKYPWLEPFYPVFTWFVKLSFWLFTISLGVGLFNLLPLGPIDGGRMFLLAALWVSKDNETKARKIWMASTLTCLLLIIINLLPYLLKLLQFIFGPIFLVVAALF